MKATFKVQVTIDNRNVTTKLGTAEGMEDMEITLMQNVLKVMANVNRSVKQQVERFYADASEETEEAPAEEETTEMAEEKTEE